MSRCTGRSARTRWSCPGGGAISRSVSRAAVAPPPSSTTECRLSPPGARRRRRPTAHPSHQSAHHDPPNALVVRSAPSCCPASRPARSRRRTARCATETAGRTRSIADAAAAPGGSTINRPRTTKTHPQTTHRQPHAGSISNAHPSWSYAAVRPHCRRQPRRSRDPRNLHNGTARRRPTGPAPAPLCSSGAVPTFTTCECAGAIGAAHQAFRGPPRSSILSYLRS